MKLLDEQIKKENRDQFKKKINKVVTRLQGKNRINSAGMWEIMKKMKRKKEEPPTAIKSKDGKVIEEPEQIKERYLEHFTEILKNTPAETEEEKRQEEFINNGI